MRESRHDEAEAIDALAASTARRVVDKMPDNIKYLGLIALLWPGARVIRCSRDPRDVAISCRLTGYAILWAKKWEHLARRFADYQRIVNHWRRLRPLEWLDVRYEELVVDVEGHARRMIEFVGLEWDPACLEFHTTERVVRTPSQVQVRQPVYAGSVGRWRHYEASLEPMIRVFEKFGVIVD